MLGFTYSFSVWRGDVDPVFPYISAAGDNRPEACMFSMFLNICSFLSMLIVYLRYSLVAELNRSSDLLLKSFNRLNLYAGLLGASGMFLVANFQETAVIQVHLFGAFLCFGSGCVYMLGQAWISYRMYPLFSGIRIAKIRGVMAIASVCLFFMAFGFGWAAANTFHSVFPDLPTPRPWTHKLVPMPATICTVSQR
uniref:CWH43-like N-terminal domain-containing protein n=1 Tax=Ditylenchus dipsaci TaxID=166011 RepID=A0A915DPA4_9BILA